MQFRSFWSKIKIWSLPLLWFTLIISPLTYRISQNHFYSLSPINFTPTADGSVLCREFEPYKNYKQYCEKLRLIMIRHISEVPEEYKKFFVDYSDRQEQAMKIAMEY